MPTTLPRLALVGVVLAAGLWLPAAVQAATAYVIDEIRVSLRASPCETCAVVQQGLASGLRLEVLEPGDGWSRVRSPEGTEGWLPSRYLTDQPIARDQLGALRQQVEQLLEENRTLQARSAGSAETPAANLTAATQAPPLGNLALVDCPDVQAENQELLKTNKLLQSEAEVLRARLEQLENNERQRWFFYGGVLVTLGAILCALLPRLKPNRRGYSEWR